MRITRISRWQRNGKRKSKGAKALFLKADYLLAIGPMLNDALADLVGHETSICLIPGLAEIEPRKRPPNTFKAFLSGRLSEDAKKMKQAHLGLAGFGHAVSLCDADEGRPDALMGKNQPRIKLRGVDFEETPCGETSEAERDICQFLEEHAGRLLTLSVLPFTQDRQILFDDLREASVALMPSWHEGFGLVAWEAIAAGVPLVLSQKSGVYKLLDQAHQSNLVLPIDPKGADEAPYFQDADKLVVANALIQVAKKKIEWDQKSAKLREALLNDFTWQKCAHQFVNAVGWNLELPISALPEEAEAPTANAASASAGPELAPTPLEIPRKNWVSGKGHAISQLLRAEEAIIPFDPARQPFLDQQKAWACDTPFPLAVRLLTGQGGTGKTRLAIELCGEMSAQGWIVGFLPVQTVPNRLRETSGQLIAVAKAGKSVLVVVDYAETRQAAILEMLAAILDAGVLQAHFRFLLLARSGGEWWAQFPSKASTCESLLLGAATTGPYVIPALHAALEARQDAYRLALDCFAKELQLPVPAITPSLSESHFEQPLYVQMAALMALHGARPTTAEALTRTLLGHEKRYWEKATSEVTPDIAHTCTAFMAMATLAGGFATVLDMEKPWVAAGWTKGDLKLLWQCLQPLYATGQGVQGLRPDLVGEALMSQALLGDEGEPLLRALLGADRTDWRNATLTVLARVLRTRQDVDGPIKDALNEHFVNCALDICTVGIETPSPLTQLAVDSFKTITPQQKAQVARILRPVFENEALPLVKLAVAVHQAECKRLDSSKKLLTPAGKAEFRAVLSGLSISYERDGQRTAALSTSKRALEISRTLDKLSPQHFRPRLAADLDYYAIRLAEGGQHSEALTLSDQALKMWRILTEKHSEFLPELAISMVNHANHLAGNGQGLKALELGEEALQIRERLANKQPARFLAHWATALGNHACHLAHNGNHSASLPLSRKSLDIFQVLAQDQPARFTSEWATSQNNYANRLADNGDHKEALEMSKQSAEKLRELALDHPERFKPILATCLRNYANRLAENDQNLEALAVSKEALDIRQQLAQVQPKYFQSEWADSLDNHASCLAECGQDTEACSFSAQALAIRHQLAQDQPDVFTDVLAVSQINHAVRLAESGGHHAALVLSDEALQSQRKLADGNYERYAPFLVHIMGNHVNRLFENGKLAEGMAMSIEQLALAEELARDQPGRYKPDWATSLSNHAVRLAEIGDHTGALTTSTQALDIRRQLASEQPERFKREVAVSLYNNAEFLANIGRMIDAMGAATEALTMMQSLVVLNPLTYGIEFDEFRLQAAHCHWLASADELTQDFEQPLKETPIRRQRSLRFLQQSLRLVAHSSGSENELRELAADCRQTWAAMDRVQRRSMEAWLFIATSISLRRMPGEALPDDDWSGRWQRYCNQRQGRIPHWITMTMTRCGGSLDNLG